MLVIVYSGLVEHLSQAAFFGQSLWQHQIRNLQKIGLQVSHLVGRFDRYATPNELHRLDFSFFCLPTYSRDPEVNLHQSALIVDNACPLIPGDTIQKFLEAAPQGLHGQSDLALLCDRDSGFSGILWVKDFGLIRDLEVSEFVTKAKARPSAIELDFVENREALRIATGADLGLAHTAASAAQIQKLSQSGVIFLQPETCLISPEVEIGVNSVIFPNCQLFGSVKVGENCQIGPNTYISNSCIGEQSQIRNSTVQETHIGKGCSVGPYANLRAGTILRDQVYIGDFVEIKKSDIGRESKVPHLSYVGDALVGQNVNIGAGAITANYDSIKECKHVTEIDDGVKVGSNSVLVAPVKIASGSLIAAGSVVTQDVAEPQSLVIGRPDLKIKPGWVAKKQQQA